LKFHSFSAKINNYFNNKEFQLISDTLALVIFIVFLFALSFFVVIAFALFLSSRRKEKKKRQNKTVKRGGEAKKKYPDHYNGNYDGVKYT
jgi:hypothetical protein